MNIVVVYKSTSGFTKRYAEWIAQELDCTLLPWRQAKASALAGCDVLVYGSRLHAGSLDGLKKARKLRQKCGAKRFVLFATGAMPNAAAPTIEEMWRRNLTPEELSQVPHFYMQAGICYEKLGAVDRAMMKLAARVITKQGAKDPAEAQMLKAIQGSYDVADKQYITPLVEYLKR